MRDHKLISGQLVKITSISLDRGGVICNPRENDLIDYGCKELIRPEQPTFAYTEEYEENETQIIVKYVEVPQVVELWHENTNFQIKITADDLLDLLEEVPAMVEYTKTLTTYRDMMFRYFYVNFFVDMERELLERYGGVITERI